MLLHLITVAEGTHICGAGDDIHELVHLHERNLDHCTHLSVATTISGAVMVIGSYSFALILI